MTESESLLVTFLQAVNPQKDGDRMSAGPQQNFISEEVERSKDRKKFKNFLL